MKVRFKKIIKKLYSLFPEECKEKLEYILEIPFTIEGIEANTSVINLLIKSNCNIAPSLKEYYLDIYPLLEDIYENIKSKDHKRYIFIKMFVNDIIPLLEMYYKILKNGESIPLERDDLPSMKEILKYMLKIYFDLGEDIYREAFKDIFDFVSNIDDPLEFFIVIHYPFLCSIDKPYYEQCINVYKDDIRCRERNIIIPINRLCQKHFKRNILKNKVLISMKSFKDLFKKIKDGLITSIDIEDFILYFFVDIYNSIFHNINVEELFKLLKYIHIINIFCFPENEIFWSLNPRLLDTFINTIINIDKINSNVLEKMSNIDISMPDFMCGVVLYDVIANEVRKGNKDNILIKICDRYDFIDQYADVFSKYEYIPSFVMAFICCMDYYLMFHSIKRYLDEKHDYLYDFNLCDIYLNNPKIIYNIVSSENFFKIYYKPIFSFKFERNHIYFYRYWILFRNFIGCMKIIEHRDKNIKFEDFILSDNAWDNSNYIVDHFLLIACFVALPMLIIKNNRNDIKYIDYVLDNIIRIVFKGRIKSRSNSINAYVSKIIENNEKVSKKFSLLCVYCSKWEKRIIGCIIFMCLLYYFGVDIISDYNLQDKIKAVFDKIDEKTSKNIFDILYILYNNLTNSNLREVIDLSTNVYGLI